MEQVMTELKKFLETAKMVPFQPPGKDDNQINYPSVIVTFLKDIVERLNFALTKHGLLYNFLIYNLDATYDMNLNGQVGYESFVIGLQRFGIWIFEDGVVKSYSNSGTYTGGYNKGNRDPPPTMLDALKNEIFTLHAAKVKGFEHEVKSVKFHKPTIRGGFVGLKI